MNFFRDQSTIGPTERKIQIVLLVFIVVGLVLLFTQSLWVPRLVYLLTGDDITVPVNTHGVGVIEPIATSTSGSASTSSSSVPITPVSTSTTSSTDTSSVSVSDSGVRGTVTIGPTCPVMQNPPSDACADKPYQTMLTITPVASGTAPISVTSTASGTFSAALVPGRYTLTAAKTAMTPPTLSPVSFTVVPHSWSELTVTFDSGIR